MYIHQHVYTGRICVTEGGLTISKENLHSVFLVSWLWIDVSSQLLLQHHVSKPAGKFSTMMGIDSLSQ